MTLQSELRILVTNFTLLSDPAVTSPHVTRLASTCLRAASDPYARGA
jgi:hypothetical protein